ncbi:ARM repeat-containing protein [Basidiobolus meristosporus CBS 931.73]|uniref:ARM repeat-containing protein n=1 Tax=Basidiobolus meristosporus CBS 931.73 TaxID=1314790 RepID=A0A1Y1ZAM1_9FUNG|nr:ARM repeat-containing protein [Basidiobolus meristosporus CBS 931.73]|eukprot:ORY07322.1 ARM repeat-containing protein [Basidiobolus meristosporus CBS 931.73]
MGKRFRHREDTPLSDRGEVEYDLTTKELEKLREKLNSSVHETRVEALKELSNFLVEPSEPLNDFILEGGAVELLEKFLAGTDFDERLQATWCITSNGKTIRLSNIAAGTPELCAKVLSTVPYLISFLEEPNIQLQEQTAWALGNIAVEGEEFRKRLAANGAITPLVKLLRSDNPELVQTVCFALSSLARNHTHFEEFFKAGVSELLLQHLKNDKVPSEVSEITWVLAYLTSGKEEYSTTLLNDGLAPLLVKHMPVMADKGSLAIPIIRTIGNIASCSDWHADSLIQQPGFLANLVPYINSELRALKKESLWVLSNLTAGTLEHVTRVLDAGILPCLVEIATHSNFDIRKEAAYITHTSNLSYAEQAPTNAPPSLAEFLDFVKTQDPETIRLGLHYVDLVLQETPRGKELLDQLQGIDALESVSLIEDPELKYQAGLLMDKYYGETAEMTSTC